MDPPQCPICAEHWINQGRPMGNYLIVSRGGHIPGVPHPPQCPTCAEHWINEGRPMGNYLIVSRGGHIPGVKHDDPTGEAVAVAAATPEQCTPERAAAAAQCKICEAYWSIEGRSRDHYLILSRGGHIPGVHDYPDAVEEPALVQESRKDPCKICVDYWLREGRPKDHYLIVSRGSHIPGVLCGSSMDQTSPEAPGTSQPTAFGRLLTTTESTDEDRFPETRTAFDPEMER